MVEQGFAVIDVNIPKHLTGTDDDAKYAESNDSEQRRQEIQGLTSYLWDNYIEYVASGAYNTYFDD